MTQTMAERVRRECGEDVDLAYMDQVLRLNIFDLLGWLVGELRDIEPETFRAAFRAHKVQNDVSVIPTVISDLRNLEERFRIAVFVLGEMRSRIQKAVSPRIIVINAEFEIL